MTTATRQVSVHGSSNFLLFSFRGPGNTVAAGAADQTAGQTAFSSTCMRFERLRAKGMSSVTQHEYEVPSFAYP